MQAAQHRAALRKQAELAELEAEHDQAQRDSAESGTEHLDVSQPSSMQDTVTQPPQQPQSV